MHRTLTAALLALSLTGCAGFVKGYNAERARQRAAKTEQATTRTLALQPGMPASAVRAAWGEPVDKTVTFRGERSVQRWQYYRCAQAASMRRKVVFVTLVDDAVVSWSMVSC